MVHFSLARQEDIGIFEDVIEGLAHLRDIEHLFANIGIERHRPLIGLDDLDRPAHGIDDAE
ncbi:hypothetical protein D3C75_1371560 [compost metagenome]